MRGAFVAIVALAGSLAALAACADTRRSLGESCLKDGDCLSGVCADQQCVATPPVLDAEPPFEDAAAVPASDAGEAGSSEAGG